MLPIHSVELGDGSAYVPDMSHHFHIDINSATTVKISDSVVDAATLLAAVTMATDDETAVDVIIAEPFGRTIQLTSDNAGALTVVGYDYLGQVMTETITCTIGTVAGTKAFKYITEFRSGAVDGDVTLKAGSGYGLPFCAVEIVRETVDGAASTEGTIATPDSTDPATATTDDTRGTFNPNTAGDGSKDISVTYITTNELAGGLYGVVQA